MIAELWTILDSHAAREEPAPSQNRTPAGVNFVGFRTDKYDETVGLFRDVMGLRVTKEQDEVTCFQMANGTVCEVYSPRDEFHAFFNTGPVVGFKVGSFAEMRRRMWAADITFIGEPQNANGISWQHFYCPDGTVAEIIGPD